MGHRPPCWSLRKQGYLCATTYLVTLPPNYPSLTTLLFAGHRPSGYLVTGHRPPCWSLRKPGYLSTTLLVAMPPNYPSLTTLLFAGHRPPGWPAITLLVLGIIVLGVGLHSHFQSGWAKNDVHKVCAGYDFAGITCPSFSLEQYYVAMIIICFILSIGSLVASIMSDTATGNLKLVVSLIRSNITQIKNKFLSVI
ncbi:unnamed protein product [Orchesella dallaii]|uniref:Uncharacterized protein n=1 Tax=Orchesella dallaii TaxID=48710 RepID=A0ABP1R5F5_9HEXA